MDLMEFYMRARTYCVQSGHAEDIVHFERLSFNGVDADNFFMKYVYVVVNSGMKNTVAVGIYKKFMCTLNPMDIGHPLKRKAIREMLSTYQRKFHELKNAPHLIDYLETLPHIGPITKYHLARDLGFDCVKPDRHMVRLAEKFDYPDPLTMCKYISERVGARLGVIDYILWQYISDKGLD